MVRVALPGAAMRARGTRLLLPAFMLALAAPALRADVLVNDTWLDSSRTDPAAPINSEMGVDSDLDGNLESAWYSSGTGASLTPSPGHLLMTMGTSSASWTTHFTPDGSPVTLLNAGDQLKITWQFTPNNVNASNTSQNFRIAVTDTPTAARLASDATPGTAAYTGYALFSNMGQTLGNANPFQLRERTNPGPGGSGAFLSSSGDWSALANGVSSGAAGYTSGTLYTMIMTLTRTAAGELDVNVTMSGGTLNGTGTASVSFTDPTPNGGSFSFDTFGIRPSDVASSASSFDTVLFKVEGPSVPEPASLAILGLSGLALVGRRSR